MATHYYGKQRALHTSSGGGEMFERGLLAFASQSSAGADEEEAVVRFLRDLCEKRTSFCLDPLPEALANAVGFRFLLKVVAELAQALSSGELPGSLLDDFYDRELQLHWAGFAAEFHGLLRESSDFGAPDLQLSLHDPDERRHFELSRLRYRLADARRSERWSEALAALEQIIDLERQGEPPESMGLRISEKADVLRKMGHTRAAVAAYREGASHAEGAERQALLEAAEELEQGAG